MRHTLRLFFLALTLAACLGAAAKIDRHALVVRHTPTVNSMDTLSSLSVGNGEFAFTADATGLQSFPEYYRHGVCLGTQTQWGWHAFPDTVGYERGEVLKAYDFGHHSRRELYACQFREKSRRHDASEYFRANPHRLHLGCIGFDFAAIRPGATPSDIKEIHQSLNMWDGMLRSHFAFDGQRYSVSTLSSPTRDMVAAHVSYEPSFAGALRRHAPITLRLPYPTGGHVDDACDWNRTERHQSAITAQGPGYGVVRHTLDATTYYIVIRWSGEATLTATAAHTFTLTPKGTEIEFSAEFLATEPTAAALAEGLDFAAVERQASAHWHSFWTSGAAVSFEHCRDARAWELERRVVLSQYLLAIQCAGTTPPQESGLTMNTWFGKFHLEMILWHQAWLPLWGHADLLKRTLAWYHRAEPMAREIAARQGFDGVRWMKMTDPSGGEAPSNVGSFLIWQQPHLIYLAELARRAGAGEGFVSDMAPLVDATARFMYSFANYDKRHGRYILKGNIPAQESLKAAVTYNSPFELSQWLTTMKMAQTWRTLDGGKPRADWQRLIDRLSPLAYNTDSLYLAAESATDTYTDPKATSDHPALLGALGFFPDSRLIDKRVMENTLDWIIDHWNWPTSWGWDFPMTAMTATRLMKPEKAIDALLLPMQKNTYLNNGHNYQDQRLRIYLPGNGGLLSAIALMCAGWDGCEVRNPGFPNDGKWDVEWEGLAPLP